MHFAERFIRYIRHSPILRGQDWFWDIVRPFYDRLLARVANRGIERRFCGGPPILILPELRSISETYEEDIWSRLIGQIKPGDVAVDIGAHFGLYTLAMAHAVTTRGKVIAFEPDRKNLEVLYRHLSMNSLADKVEVVESAVGDKDEALQFYGDRSSVSRIAAVGETKTTTVTVTKLDTFFRDRPIDVVKMDVEGYEARVLKGASTLLADPVRRPRLIFIEMHPHLWAATGATRTEVFRLLEQNEYCVETIHGSPLDEDNTFEIVASAKHPRQNAVRLTAS